jgi:hypothetical protein
MRMGDEPIRGRNSITKISSFIRTKIKNKRDSAKEFEFNARVVYVDLMN